VRLVQTAAALAVLAALAWTPLGDAVDRALDGLLWWLEEVAFAAVCVACVTLVMLPLSFWAGYVRERRFGLSTQTLRGWVADRLKGLAIGGFLTAVVVLALAALVRAAPTLWPLLAAVGAVLLVVVLGFLAPVVLEPVFNRFRPLADAELAARLRALAGQAGAPVRDVLVSDASRRTRKLNAYVSGLGRTRRLVLFDTLLERARVPEVEAVVAHELGHRRERHVEKLTALGALGTAVGVVVLRLVLGDDAGEPRAVPEILFVFGVLELVGAAAFAPVARRYEREADRAALELTRDPAAVEAVFRELAAANVADLVPPRLLHALFATHPTIPERIAAARSFGRVLTSASPNANRVDRSWQTHDGPSAPR